MGQILRVTATVLLVIVLSAVYCHAKEKAISKQKLYTAYNIWKWNGFNMRCINYKGGRSFIPAGTEVSDPKVKNYCNSPDDCTKIISFKTAADNKIYKVFYNKRLKFHCF